MSKKNQTYYIIKIEDASKQSDALIDKKLNEAVKMLSNEVSRKIKIEIKRYD